MIKVVVYDCDGVIVDSKESILLYYNWLLDKCGLPPVDWSLDELRLKALSMADRDILELLSGGDDTIYRKMLDIAASDERGDAFDAMTLETGLPDGFEAVKQKGLPMAVFTNRGHSLPRLLEHFKIKEYFDMLITARDVSLPKPSPEGLLKICAHFNIEPGETLFIGDSPTDYHAAKVCGAQFLAFKKTLWDAPVIDDHRLIAGRI